MAFSFKISFESASHLWNLRHQTTNFNDSWNIPLIDIQLFGHIKASFTGATGNKKGYFEQADGGTVFLDEIGELSCQAQVKLLRVLQYMEFIPVGGPHPKSMNIRIIAATHKDLPAMVREKKFREDLLYRLNVFPIKIPPLRDRKEDIPLLAEFFAIEKGKGMNRNKVPPFNSNAFKQLQGYDWPGNVRKNLIKSFHSFQVGLKLKNHSFFYCFSGTILVSNSLNFNKNTF